VSRRGRPRLAMYWASACGGCEVAVLNLGERILLLDRFFEIVFFPALADFKLADLQAYPDEHIDLCLFNGAIHSTADREMARLLRRKSRLLVAFGSCADEGCVPALINLSTAADTLDTVFRDTASSLNPDDVIPVPRSDVAEGELSLPTLHDAVRTLDQVEDVDYVVPGCPPESQRVWETLELFVAALSGSGTLPPRGAVLGAKSVALCEECALERKETPVERFVRPHQATPDPGSCLLDQGLVCLGVATRGGCGALCPEVGMGCRGCYGALDGVADQGARLLSAMASIVGTGSPQDDETELYSAIEKTASTFVDPVGTVYRFSLARSLRWRRHVESAQPCGDHGDETDHH